MSREYFDLLVVVPLEEELHEVGRVFKAVKNYSTDTSFRYSYLGENPDISILVVQQDGMGKTYAARAVSAALAEFDIGLIVCIGIAGSMHGDARLGDVCYTGTIIDVYDNTKASDANGSLDIEFSPTHHKTMREVTAAINFVRTLPDHKERYEAWQTERETFAKTTVPKPVRGRDGKAEQIGKPHTQSGVIVCGAVSKSDNYNKKLRALDRKILAIETESGGVFEEAISKKTPAVTIRGICDYADENKNQLEGDTVGGVRRIAAANAATFLNLQLGNESFVKFVKSRRAIKDGAGKVDNQIVSTESSLTVVLSEIGQEIDSKLRELSPEFRLQPKGYRLPIPRIRHVDYTADPSGKSQGQLTELKDALQIRSVILLNISRTYPDNSLPWVLADDLLTTDLTGKQAIPVVIDGERIGPPQKGLLAATSRSLAEHVARSGETLPIFIVENVPLNSKTRMSFLIDQVKQFPAAKFVFITRSNVDILKQSEFVGKLSAHVYTVCDISFLEIAHFIEKNFSMKSSEAEVIALRLRNTFNQFNLSAHPTYFAGIPRETLSALLQANRRAELIQLAVDGFLTFVVADDPADISLSRTTRSRFLRRLAVAINVEKMSFSQAELVTYTQEFSTHFDFDIDSLEFIQAFVGKGILHFENDVVRFSLPFIEAYLLALELKADDKLALRYFQTHDTEFDLITFDLYAELGASQEMVARVTKDLATCLQDPSTNRGEKHIFLGEELRPVILGRPGKIESLQRELKKAVEAVQTSRDDAREKQRVLDIADQIREDAAEASEKKSQGRKETQNENIERIGHSIRVWAIGTVLLGSGAEHLDAQTKQNLAKLLIELAVRVIDEWTTMNAAVDFTEIKERLISPKTIEKFMHSGPAITKDELEGLIGGLVDVLEYSFLGEPFRRILHHLCEQARQKVLAPSIEKAKVEGEVENVLHGTWLADVDCKRGGPVLSTALKQLSPAPFFRVGLASHFLTRVYWSHSQKEDKLILLDAAEELIRPIKFSINKPQIKRLIEKSEKDGKDSTDLQEL